MTEDEMKTKWCPAYRVATSGGDCTSTFETDNRPYDYEQSVTDDPMPVEKGLNRYGCCIGSQCAVWRWSEARRTAAFLEAVQATMQAQAKPNFNTAAQSVYAETGGKFERVEGYCGLAGAPQ